MYRIEQLENRNDFLYIVNSVTYKESDEEEAKEFGYMSVKQMYNVCMYYYSKFYVIYDNEDAVLCTIELKRDGHLIYFVTDALTPFKIPTLVRTVKHLADLTVEKVDNIFTTTMNSYTGAIRFNELVGFTLKIDKGVFSIWAYEKEK